MEGKQNNLQLTELNIVRSLYCICYEMRLLGKVKHIFMILFCNKVIEKEKQYHNLKAMSRRN